jgi:ABC-type molybdate transport system substrate-binding protein
MGQQLRIVIGLLAAVFSVACNAPFGDPPSSREQVGAGAGGSVELRVNTSGGFAAALELLGPQFGGQGGTPVLIEYGSSSGGAADSIPLRYK